NIVFKYSNEQKKLEDDIEGFSFRLPKDSYQLCEIGTALHNCVASYAENVQKQECTIVYVQKNGEYKICIEVRGNEIVQERIDRNASPSEEEKAVLEKWHDSHGHKVTNN
ncbi:MAG: PcfJ domain-containing protein, partial [Treponema sp.]|nr:PcfJ domain-containing protein [Treponema sp.]